MELAGSGSFIHCTSVLTMPLLRTS